MIYKCEICRQTYIMEKAPQNCPFCGSFSEHIKPIKDVPDIEKYELTEISKKNIYSALQKELNAVQLYKNNIKNSESNVKFIFEILVIHEKEHSELLTTELINHNIEISNINDFIPIKSTKSDEKNIETAMIAEASTIVYYKKYIEEAIEPRIKLIFKALQEVEQLHLDLIN